MSLNEALMQFVRSTASHREKGIQIDEKTPLIDQGLVDSIGLMQIVALVEKETGIRIPDDEISPDNFSTIESILTMVERLDKPKGREA